MRTSLFGARSVIVVLDDDVSVCRALVRVLQATGHTARGFTSGAEFLNSLHFDSPDCLLLDLQMPGLSGVKVLQALSETVADFPVIIISAHEASSVREEAMSHGAVAYLGKPVDAAALVSAVIFATNKHGKACP